MKGTPKVQRIAPKTQWGVQIIPHDLVRWGVPEGREPQWFAFNSENQANHFAETYESQISTDPESLNNVKAVNRSKRWAIEEYGPWVSE